MECKETHNNLIFYLEGEFDPITSRQVEAHLQNCSSCRDQLGILRSAFEVIEIEKSKESNPYLLSKIMNKLEEENAPVSFSWMIKLLQPALLSLLLIVSIGSGIYIGTSFVPEHKTAMNSELTDPYFNEIENESIELFFLNDAYHE